MNCWGIRQTMNDMNVFKYAFPYNWKYPAGILKNISRTPRVFKWAWQRINQGVADCDVWNFDSYLTSIIPIALRELAEGVSYPHAFNSAEEWHDLLNEIADEIEFGAADELTWFPENFDCTSNEYMAEKRKREKARRLGFERIAQYLDDLWD